jgi:hypothetical protein
VQNTKVMPASTVLSLRTPRRPDKSTLRGKGIALE